MRTLKNKIYKYIISISKNVYINYFIVGRGVRTPLFYEDPQYITYPPPFSNFVDFFFKGGEGGTPTMKLNDIVNKDNNKYHKTIKMNSGDVNVRIQIDFGIENNKFKVADHVRILKYKNLFAKIFWKRLTK